MLTTPDGIVLGAELDVPADAWAAVVLAHPHPPYGGSMRDGAPTIRISDELLALVREML